jgi:ribA/ribD-fused uncharacterized protein
MSTSAREPRVVTDVTFWAPEEVPFGALSNLYPRPIVLDGVGYRTAEHAIKAAEARRPEVRDWLASAPTAELAALAGGVLPAAERVPGWTEQRLSVMRKILAAKFRQHADLRALLLSTGKATIVELAPDDDPVNRFWSRVAGGGVGENWLGRLLMDLRADLERETRE